MTDQIRKYFLRLRHGDELPKFKVAQMRIVHKLGLKLWHAPLMSLILNFTHDGDLRKKGLRLAVADVQERSSKLPKPTDFNDPTIEVDIFVSGNTWSHDKSGFKLGTLSERGREWQRVMVYVPDELSDENETRDYFDKTFGEIASAVEVKLRKRRPNWPIESLVRGIRSLRPSSPTV